MSAVTFNFQPGGLQLCLRLHFLLLSSLEVSGRGELRTISVFPDDMLLDVPLP